MDLKKGMLLMAVALLILLTTGCNQQRGTSIPETFVEEDTAGETLLLAMDGERLYSIPLSDTVDWVIDRDGQEFLLPEEELEYSDLVDLATGEARYRCRVRREDTGQRGEWGNVEVQTLCALYDLDGNQLLDWEEKSYFPAFGDYIIRQDSLIGIVSADEVPENHHTALYHVPTGTESYEGAFGVDKLDDNAFLLYDNWHTPLGVVNLEGEAVSGFPPQRQYYSAYVWNGYMTASSEHPNDQKKERTRTEYLLDKNFQELFVCDWISGHYGNLRGDYLAYQIDQISGVLHPEEGVLFTVGDDESVEYYDGELAIVQAGSYRSQDNPIDARLVTVDHKELASGFSWLMPAQNYEDVEPAEAFLGIQGGKAVLLGRDGKILASSAELPGARSLSVVCDGLYTYRIETDELHGEGLLGSELEVLVPADLYTWIDLPHSFWQDEAEWDGSAENVLLQADKEIGSSNEPGKTIYRIDILDHTGRVVVNNVTTIYDIGSDRIALKRGFDVGLMDWEGNWITKQRIFQGFGDD